MKRVIIFVGPPAGGKTSAAHKLAERLLNSVVIEVDPIKERISGSVHGKDDIERELWFSEINKEFRRALETSDNVIIDEGFFENQYLNKILKGVKNVKQTIVEINYSLEEHLKRDGKRKGDEPGAVRQNYYLYKNASVEEKINPDIFIADKDLTPDEIAGKIVSNLN